MKIAIVLTLLALGLTTPASAAAEDVAPAVSVPSIGYTGRTLANGARVYAIRDTASPTASVNVWYNVGQRDDPRGRGGFAHLFEHLMFKTTRNLAQGVTPFVTSLGGETNATTLFDTTVYYMTAPSNQLEALLWVEGERLRNLIIDDAAFRAERDVVKEELRQRIFAQPYGRILYTLLPGFGFGNHPYARPIGGTIADLDQATLADVQAFHEAYYRPDNAIFVISGNFDPATLDAWVDRYLGSIPRPAAPMPRDASGVAGDVVSQAVNAYAPNVPLPAVVFSWRAPRADDADAAGIAMIEALLAGGRSARLRRQLIDQAQLASNITSYNLPARDGHAFALVLTLAQGADLAQAETAFAGEIARLRDAPIGVDELVAVKNAMLGQALSGRELPRGRAFELGDAIAMTGDPAAADRRLQAIRDMTAADLQRVARRWLADDRRVTIRYRDESARPAGVADPVPTDVSAMGPIVPPPTRPAVSIAPEGERQSPPAGGTSVARAIPTIADRTLSNGLRVVAAQSSAVPLTTMKLVIGGGDAADPAGRAGLADVMAALALRGAGSRDAATIAQAFAGLGGSISASADPDATTITVTVPAANAEAAGRLLADIVRRPAFAAAELDRVRRQQGDALAVAARQPMQAGLRVLPTAALAGTPYGAIPTVASLAALGPQDIATAQRAWWTPGNATLIVTGGLDADRAFALANALFGDWRAEGGRFASARRATNPAPQVLAIDIPSAGQAAVLVAVPVIGRAAADWPALRLANARLGLGRESLLTQELRVRRGLTYGAGSLLDERRAAALAISVTQTRNDAADQVVGLIQDQMRRLSGDPIGAAELAARDTFLTSALGSQTERTAGLADYLATLVVTGAPLATARAELAGEGAPTPAEVTAAATRYYRADAATIVVAGDARQWIVALRQRFPQVRQVTADGTPAP